MGSTNDISWKSVNRGDPCPCCEHDTWCTVSEDGNWCNCRRLANDHEKVDSSGGTYYVHRLTPWPERERRLAPPEPTVAVGGDGKAERASPEVLNKVYRALLKGCPLSKEHQAALRKRGFDPQEARRRGYGTLGKNRLDAVTGITKAGLEKHLPNVPGFYVREKPGKPRCWSVKGAGGILVPVCNTEGLIVGVLLRKDAPGPGNKYVWLSSKNAKGVGPGSPTHHPRFDGDKTVSRVTEGALKADLATLLSHTFTIGISSTSTWRNAAPALRAVGAKTVRVAFDADCRTNRQVAQSLANVVNDLLAKNFAVELETWPIEDGKGIDDLLAAGKQPDVIAGEEAVRAAVAEILAAANAADPPPKNPNGGTSKRPTILIGTDERRVNNQAIAALAAEPALFYRGGMLVRLVREHRPPAEQAREHVRRAEGAPRVLPVEEPTLQEMMADVADWQKHVKGEVKPAHPPGWSVRAVARRGSWPQLRYLDGVVESPTVRADGTVVEHPGYDPASGLIYDPSADFPPLLAAPTREDATRAADLLLALVEEFPFAGPCDKAAWLAALLTALARPAVDGPCPCFLFEASTAGSGKTLLAKLIGVVASGREPAVSELSSDGEEQRKAITSIALEGERLVLLDNASGLFGSPSLDAALTSTVWKGRVLGKSQRTADLPLTTVWFATGNNLRLVGDTHRRVLPCRLEPDTEKPEERAGFRIPDLLAHARGSRPALVAAGLTVLLAHHHAGRPQAKLPHFGSYESWSRVIRQAVYWVTTFDPCETRQGIEPVSRGDLGTLAAVLAAWAKLPGGDGKPGLTAKAALDHLKPKADGLRLTRSPYGDLRAALAEWAKEGDLPDAKVLGNRFRAAKGRVAGGRKLCSQEDANTRLVGWWSEKVRPGSA